MADEAAVLDAPVVEAAGEEGAAAGADGAAAAEPRIDPKTGQPIVDADKGPDGRNQPDALRKHLAALKADPATAAVAKTITDRVGKTFGYEQAFPTVREAKEAKTLIESFGGRESITAAVESHAAMQRVDALLEAGDPAVLEDIFKQAPEGMAKLVPGILDKLATLNPAAYDSAIGPHAVALMGKAGLPGAINSLVDAFDAPAGPNREAAMKDILGRIVQWYSGLMKGAAPKAADPERVKFEKEKTDWNEKQSADATKATFDTTTAYAGGKIDAALVPEIKRLGLGQKASEALRQDVWTELQRVRNADAVYKSGLSAQFEGKKPKAGAVAYLNGYTDRLMKDAIASAVATRYGDVKVAARVNPTAPKVAAKGAAVVAAAAGSTRVTGPPPAKDIDYEDKRTDTFAGRAVLKSTKKLVNWR